MTFCISCGARLAAPTWPTDETRWDPTPGPTVSAAAPPTMPPAGPPPGGTGVTEGGRSAGRGVVNIVLIALGVVVLGVCAVLVARALRGDSGGASSPEAAVQNLAQAIDSEDLAGAANALAPDEVRTLSDLLSQLEDRAQKSGVGGKSKAFDGVDLQVDDLELDVEELSDTVARVEITNLRARAGVDKAKLSERLQPVADGDTTSATIDEDDLQVSYWDDDDDRSDIDPFLMVVKRGGGWYVSPTYTVAAYEAEIEGLPDGDFDEEVPDGLDAAGSPEEAAVALAESVDELDPEEWLGALPSDEWSALWVYRRAVGELIDDATDNGESFRFDVDDQDLEVSDLPSGYKKVAIKSATGTFETTDDEGYEESTDWELDGLCLETDSDDDGRSEDCLDDGDSAEDLVDTIGLENLFVVAKQDRGGWVISPTATILEYGKEYLAKVPDAWLYSFVGLEWLAPPAGTATLGEPIDVTLNEAGFATYDVPTKKGDRLIATLTGGDADEDSYGLWAEVVDRRGDYLPRYRLEGADADGLAHVVVYGDPGDTTRLVVASPRVKDLPTSGAADGTLRPEVPMVEYRFTVPGDGTYTASAATDDSVDLEVLTEDDDYVDCESDYEDEETTSCELEADTTYVIRVTSYQLGSETDAIDYRLTVEAGAADDEVSIDGSDYVDGYVSGGDSEYHSVIVPDGVTAEIELSGPPATDLDLFCADDSCEPSVSYGSDESITITGPFDGEIYVKALDDSADYSLTISGY